MFVKHEKLNGSKKTNPDPRAIQFRNVKYCVALGKYLKPMEHLLYRLRGSGKNSVLPPSRVIGKGLSSVGRAQLLVSKLAMFEKPVVLSLDGSRFDLHVARELLQIEHLVYTTMNGSRKLRQLLAWQLDNKGKSDGGIKYKCRGRRMSGDMNTALGNCLLMIIMVATFMRGKKYDMLDDGDDCLLIIESSDLEWVLANVTEAFLEYGMEVKIENIAHSLEEIEWCQCRPIRLGGGRVRFVRDYNKVLSTALSGTKYFMSTEGSRRKLVNTIGMSELILNLGVPVLQEYAIALMRNAATGEAYELNELESYFHRLKRELKERNLRQLTRVKPQPITDEARFSFFLAYGLGCDEQLELESFLRQWRFCFAAGEKMTAEWDVANWKELHYRTAELYSPRE
jgi:hypothetical protein